MLLSLQILPFIQFMSFYAPDIGVCLYTKVSLILVSQKYSQEMWISWAESFLVGQIYSLFILHASKIFPLIFFLLLLKETKGKTEQIKRIVFCVCKINNKVIWFNKSYSAHEIHVSWLYYGDIKIKDTFVYKHIQAR